MFRLICRQLGRSVFTLGTCHPVVSSVCALLIAGARASPAAAQEKELHAFHIIAQPPPGIDGHLDDEVWHLADAVEDFTQDEPDNMAPPTERTVVQVAYDDNYLYVAAHCHERDPSQILSGLGRRDNYPPSDVFEISLDPRHDHLTAYVFRVNASGVLSDLTFFDDTRSNNDYDGVWDARTATTSEGWNAEFRIPFSQMRFDIRRGERVVWGLQLRRDIQRRGEFDRWVASPRGEQGFVSRFGHLVLADGLQPPRRVELLPYAISSVQSVPTEGTSRTSNAGFDVRLGVGNSATLSATVNPDFGQVEADPSVLNLSVFETFLPEKRPFFLEDSRVFVLPYGQFPDFYSRRIGQTPGRFELASSETLVSKPDQTTILGAAKITGKASKWTYGGLGALTAREYATVDDATTDSAGLEIVNRRTRLIEPLTMYSIGRLQRDTFAASNVGLIGTAVIRDEDLDAFTGGIDHNFRWAQNRLTLNGHWLATHAPIEDVLRTDYGGANNVTYAGKHVSLSGHVDHFGRDFRNNDLGFLTSRTNKNEANGGFTIIQPDPWKTFRHIEFDAGTGRQWNGDGDVFGRWVTTNAFVRTQHFWTVNGGYTHTFRRVDDLDTRGGPPIQRAAGDSYSASISTDTRKNWGLNLNFFRSRDRVGAWDQTIASGLRLQPVNRLQASVDANYQRGMDVAQWIRNEDADGDGVTDHVYGQLRRDVLSVTTRATYAFTRDMTVEAYLQPFVAVGDYTNIRKLARPRSFDFTPVTTADDVDFNRKSVRGTVVLRWEYLRGSTLFVVWNLTTSDPSRPGVFSAWQDLGTAFRGAGTNVFVVKLNYWFTP